MREADKAGASWLGHFIAFSICGGSPHQSIIEWFRNVLSLTTLTAGRRWPEADRPADTRADYPIARWRDRCRWHPLYQLSIRCLICRCVTTAYALTMIASEEARKPERSVRVSWKKHFWGSIIAGQAGYWNGFAAPIPSTRMRRGALWFSQRMTRFLLTLHRRMVEYHYSNCYTLVISLCSKSNESGAARSL